MVSAMGQRENVIEAIKGGAENFIVKPFNADKILRVIKGLKLSPTLNFDQT
jgi:two-component system chemotaxis response regulator CheY